MKQLLFTCILLVTAMSLFAQKGLFGISYGDTYKAVKDNLTNYSTAFEIEEESGSKCVYVSYENEYIDRIVCYFDKPKGSLVSWQVFYLEQEDEDVWDVAYDAASDWHDEGEWDYDYEVYYWDFGSGKTLYLGYNSDYWLVADYYNDSYSQYSEIVYW